MGWNVTNEKERRVWKTLKELTLKPNGKRRKKKAKVTKPVPQTQKPTGILKVCEFYEKKWSNIRRGKATVTKLDQKPTGKATVTKLDPKPTGKATVTKLDPKPTGKATVT